MELLGIIIANSSIIGNIKLECDLTSDINAITNISSTIINNVNLITSGIICNSNILDSNINININLNSNITAQSIMNGTITKSNNMFLGYAVFNTDIYIDGTMDTNIINIIPFNYIIYLDGIF